MSFILKPSALASQASNLEYYKTGENDSSSSKGRIGETGFALGSVSGSSSSQRGETSGVPSLTPGSCEKNGSESSSAVSNPSPSDEASSGTRSSAAYVFGQRLTERITNAAEGNGAAKADDEEAESKGMLFTAALKSTEGSGPSEENGQKSLSESAAEFEKSASKRKFGAPEDVEVTTGEEGERNVVHVLGKLFRYDPLDKRWQERGTGQVRLNDSRTDGSSRVVVRTQGSYKLILNSKLFPRMVLERASTKGVKITAVDSEDTGLVRVFLIKCGSPSDAENLESAILRRINVLREQEEKSEKETQDDDQSPVNKRLKTDDASENVEDPSQGGTSRQSTSETTIQSTPEAQQTQSLPVHTTEEEESTTPS